MTPFRVVVADDEKPARERLRRLIAADRRVELAACCSGGAEAIAIVGDAACAGTPVHLLLLDVQMPEIDGFGVVAALVRQGDPGGMPAIIFVTAHDEYALRAFEAHAIDYLLKPFSDERFEAALDRVVNHLRAGEAQAMLSRMQALLGGAGASIGGVVDGGLPLAAAPVPVSPRAAAPRAGAPLTTPATPAMPAAPAMPATSGPATLDRIVLKGADRVRLLPVQQITWIEAAGMYVRLHMRDGTVHLHRSLLGQLDAALDGRRFIRVHRSAIVNIDVIDELQPDVHGDYTVVLKDRTEIRLGRRYRERLQSRLGQDL